jgi:phage terminase large subunit
LSVRAKPKWTFPDALSFVFEPARYKVAYGGRGSAKSWSFARALLIQGAQRPLRVLCAREFQKSIAESVHKLLADQVAALGLGAFYEVQQNTIRGVNGTEFSFHGLRHNVANIKSVEGTDIAWVEEAQTVSKASWDTLIPTIRKAGSEIWVSFNPELETDTTYQRFVTNPPTGAVVRRVNWSDNPWFPEVLRVEMEDMKARDPDGYLTVWEGHCRQALDGAIFAEEIRAATAENRITRVPYEPTKPVHTFWDLGYADNTSIWLAQVVGFEFRVIGYISASQKPLGWYVAELQKLPYVWGDDWLPHDAKARTLGTGRSVEEMAKSLGRSVKITPNLRVEDGINAARSVFGKCWFDAEKAADGLMALRHYRYEVDPETKQRSRKPLHDWASHGADAFRYLAVALAEAAKPAAPPPPPPRGPNAWAL